MVVGWCDLLPLQTLCVDQTPRFCNLPSKYHEFVHLLFLQLIKKMHPWTCRRRLCLLYKTPPSLQSISRDRDSPPTVRSHRLEPSALCSGITDTHLLLPQGIRQHTPAYVSIRQYTTTYVVIRQQLSPVLPDTHRRTYSKVILTSRISPTINRPTGHTNDEGPEERHAYHTSVCTSIRTHTWAYDVWRMSLTVSLRVSDFLYM